MLFLLVVACGEPYDVYGGGEVVVEFGGYVERGFVGTAEVEGARRRDIEEDLCNASELLGFLVAERDRPAFAVRACGAGKSGRLTHSDAGDREFDVTVYGDQLEASVVTALECGGSCSMTIDGGIETVPGTEMLTRGVWQSDTVDAWIDGLEGSISGSMDFAGQILNPSPPVGPTYEVWTPPGPSEWTQEVTVTFSFSESEHRVYRHRVSLFGDGFGIGFQ